MISLSTALPLSLYRLLKVYGISIPAFYVLLSQSRRPSSVGSERLGVYPSHSSELSYSHPPSHFQTCPTRREVLFLLRVAETRGSRSSRATTGDSHVVVSVVGAGAGGSCRRRCLAGGTVHLTVWIDLLVLVMIIWSCYVPHYQIDPACSSKIRQGSVNPSQSI